MRSKLVSLIVLFLCVLSFSAFGAQYKYVIKVIAPTLQVYQAPNFSSKVVASAKKDQVFEMVEKKNDWLRIKVKLAGQGYIYGWVEASQTKYKVFRTTVQQTAPSQPKSVGSQKQPMATIQQSAPPKKEAPKKIEKQKKEPKQKKTSSSGNAFREEPGFVYRLFGAPVYNIKDYFSSTSLSTLQARFGLAIDRVMSDSFWLSVPVMYTQGQGFKTIGGGVDGYFSPVDMGKIMLYGKLGA
ncbi:MAG: SH3 domain-containing protein, partial [Bdellovibrionales bacterium]|nr:SH3 domain-containing protein [Bdellovibrionales bacterium]